MRTASDGRLRVPGGSGKYLMNLFKYRRSLPLLLCLCLPCFRIIRYDAWLPWTIAQVSDDCDLRCGFQVVWHENILLAVDASM